MTALLWDRAAPNRCACGNAYRPQLTRAGKLVKTREPAWRMYEQRPRDKACLQELHRSLAREYRLGYQHHSTSKGSGAGYPDVHLWTALRVGGGGSAYLELKRMGNDPTADQVRVMAELQDATPGRRVYLTRPCCLLVGAVDEIMAELAGVKCRYIEGNPDGPVFPIPPAEGPPRHAPSRGAIEPVTAAPPARPARAPLFRQPPPPGDDPEPFTPAVGYLVPQPAGPAAATAILELEQWLRAAGFPPMNVPYPIRVVAGPGRVHVHCRIGLARPGSDQRVWRGGAPATRFPDYLVDALRATVVDDGTSSATVAAQVEAALPGATQPA